MERKGKRWGTACAAVVGVLAIATPVLLSACSTTRAAEVAKNASAVPALSVEVASVRSGRISQTLSYTGDVKAKSQVTVMPKVAGRIEEMRVDVGSEVQAGAVIAVVEHGALDLQVRQAEAALAAAKAKLATLEAGGRSETVGQAEANLDAAKQRLVAMNKGPRAELVTQAEANLKSAESRLKQLKDGPTAEQRRAAQMNVEGAKVKLHAANVEKDAKCNPANPDYICSAAQANAIGMAYLVDAAQAQFDALIAPPTDELLAQAQAAVDAAREQLHLAQNPFTEQDTQQAKDAVKIAEQQLSLARNPFTKQDLDAARAGADQATAALDLTKLQLKDANVTAPISGVVSERLLSVGNMAAPQTPLVNIVDRDVEVQVAVEESKAVMVVAGQAVSLTVSAYPGQVFPATVGSVAPTVDPRTRTVAVKLMPDNTGSQLKPGMFAQATILVAERDSALLMPREAVLQRDGKPVAFVVREGFAAQRPVSIGLRDDRNVEVLDGVAGDDQVIVSGATDVVDGSPVAAGKR